MNGRACIKQYLTKKWLVGLPSSILVRSECFKKLGNFDQVGLDPEMWLRICSKYDFYYVDKPLTKWRIHEKGSFTSNHTKESQSLRRKMYIYNKIKAFNYSYIEGLEIRQLVRKKKLYLRIKMLQTYFNYKHKLFLSYQLLRFALFSK